MDCFVACAPRNDGAPVLSVIASASEAIHCRHKKGGLLRRVAPRKDSAVVAGKHHSCHTRRMRDPGVSAVALIATPRPPRLIANASGILDHPHSPFADDDMECAASVWRINFNFQTAVGLHGSRRRCAPPHHEGLNSHRIPRPHPEEPAGAGVSKDGQRQHLVARQERRT